MTIPELEENEIVDPTPYRLLRSESEAIGRIITAASELEHITTIALFEIMKINAADGYILFGKDTLGARIAKLRSALRHNEKERAKWKAFNNLKDDIQEVTNFRNMFSHGVFMGIKEGMLHYITTLESKQISDDTFKFVVQRVRLSELKLRVQQVEEVVLKIRKIFGVSALHEKFVLRGAMSKLSDQ